MMPNPLDRLRELQQQLFQSSNGVGQMQSNVMPLPPMGQLPPGVIPQQIPAGNVPGDAFAQLLKMRGGSF